MALFYYFYRMTIEHISKVIEENDSSTQTLKIEFKKRNAIKGRIIKGRDYSDLKSKNFWRIVTDANLEEWNKSQNIDLAKIYSGTEFTKLSLSKKVS